MQTEMLMMGDPLFEHIANFERFLRVVGFKRIEARIYGLLVLSPAPLTSSAICKSLDLSQGAVSQGVNQLVQWGAVESRYEKEKGAQVHQAIEDTLKTLSTVFQKREQSAIGEFKDMARRCIEQCGLAGDSSRSARIRRLESIVTTCEGAEAIIGFTNALARTGNQRSYARIFRTLPKTLNLLLTGSASTQRAAQRVKSRFSRKGN